MNEIELKSEPKDNYMIEKSGESLEMKVETTKVEAQYFLIPMVYVMPYCVEIKQ